MRRAWAAVGMLAAMAGCGGGGAKGPAASPTSAPTTTVRGAVVIKSDPLIGTAAFDGSTCDGASTTGSAFRPLTVFDGSVKDITAGAHVDVSDESGKILGTATLGRGTWDRDHPSCRIPFVIEVAPAKFYRVRVGSHPDQTFPAGSAPIEVVFQG